MQNKLYQLFHQTINASLIAFQYGEDHYDELMSRPVSYILYGPPSYGTGAAFPSRRLMRDSDRILKNKNRRQTYTAYHFDHNWDLLYSRHFNKGNLDCTLLHYWIDGKNFARSFFRDQCIYYAPYVFSVEYNCSVPVLCSMADKDRLYIEYYKYQPSDLSRTLTDFTWYDYYPNRIITKEGIPISKAAPFGAPNSPVSCGHGKISFFIGEERNKLEDALNCWMIV